ncbi:hypothetical protein N8778_02180 [Verrucomicrobia bacterium]|nr:hypothetical protein [Verrucomicrobiota bacterium]
MTAHFCQSGAFLSAGLQSFKEVPGGRRTCYLTATTASTATAATTAATAAAAASTATTASTIPATNPPSPKAKASQHD